MGNVTYKPENASAALPGEGTAVRFYNYCLQRGAKDTEDLIMAITQAVGVVLCNKVQTVSGICMLLR